MNYIKQINAFYHQIEVMPLSGAAMSLWHSLTHMNNKARWAAEFTVPASTLRLKAGLSDSGFKRARKELEAKGYIKYRSRGGNLSAVYQMVCLFSEMVSASDENDKVRLHNEPADVTEEGHIAGGGKPIVNHNTTDSQRLNDKPDGSLTHSPNHKPAPLNKHKEKQKENNTAEGFYKKYIGMPNPFTQNELQKAVHAFGDDLVIEAMERALERNKYHWAYVNGILQNWHRKGIRTIEEAQKEQERHGYQHRFQNQAKEVVPDWFIERKREKEAVNPQAIEENPEAKRSELETLLMTYS